MQAEIIIDVAEVHNCIVKPVLVSSNVPDLALMLASAMGDLSASATALFATAFLNRSSWSSRVQAGAKRSVPAPVACWKQATWDLTSSMVFRPCIFFLGPSLGPIRSKATMERMSPLAIDCECGLYVQIDRESPTHSFLALVRSDL